MSSEDLKRQIILLKTDLETKDQLISILEKRVESLEKLSKYSKTDSTPSNIVSKPEKQREDLTEEDLVGYSIGQIAFEYAKKGRETKSFRDEQSSKGREIPYDPNPVGRLGGKEVRIENTRKTIFEQE